MFCDATFSNRSFIEETTKCLFQTSFESTHSIRMCFTVSGHWQVPHSWWRQRLENLITSGLACKFYYCGCGEHAFLPVWLKEVVRGWYCSYILKHISFYNNLDFYFCLKNNDLCQPWMLVSCVLEKKWYKTLLWRLLTMLHVALIMPQLSVS